MLNHSVRISALIIFVFGLLAFAQSAPAQTKRPVRFAANTNSATLRGKISGYAYTDYLVRARGGQTITVELSGTPVAPVFSILQPDGNNLENAAQSNSFSGTLPDTGVYVVRVGLMRAFARRRQSTNFTLKISID